MAFCTNCGSDVQGRFCAKCGTPIGAEAAAGSPSAGTAPPPPPPSYSSSATTAPPQAQASGIEENVACALCYVLGLLTGILFLVLAPYNQNRLIRFHAFQSIFVHLSSFVFFIALMIAFGVLHFIPFLGTVLAFLSLLLYPIAGLGFFVLYLMLIYKAYNKERWVLPIIGPLAEKQA